QRKRLGRLAFEVDNHELALGRLEHLAEVVVAVVSRFSRAEQRLDPVGTFDQLRGVHAVAAIAKSVERVLDFLADRVAPLGGVSAGNRFDVEVGAAARLRKCDVQRGGRLGQSMYGLQTVRGVLSAQYPSQAFQRREPGIPAVRLEGL